MMMSVEKQSNHFKRSREEDNEPVQLKKRKLEDEKKNEFQSNMYKSYIKSALEALDNVSKTFTLRPYTWLVCVCADY